MLPEIPKTASLIPNLPKAQIKIICPLDKTDIARIRSIPGQIYHSNGLTRYWVTPLTYNNLKLLKTWGFKLDESLEKLIVKSSRTNYIKLNPNIDIPGLKGTLRPFQKIGVAFLEYKNGRALIADEMGLGKTIQALAYLQLHPEFRPAIIVCPSSLKLNWLQEILDWMPYPKARVLFGRKPKKQFYGKIFIINYDILHAWRKVLKKLNPQILIADECHFFKNNSADRTQAIKRLAKTIPHVIGLSGTPIENRPLDIFNIANILDPITFPDRVQFCIRYCDRKYSGYGWDDSGASNTIELHEKLITSIMIRRKKKDVLPELPDKTYSYVPIELDNKKEYQEAHTDFIAFVEKNKGTIAAERALRAQALTKIETLKQLAIQGKFKHAINWIGEFLEVEDKLVVICIHTAMITEIMSAFPDISVKIDGSVATNKRQSIVHGFQTDPSIKLCIINVEAGGVGITLTAAYNVAVLELPWNPGKLAQAIDRIHRIGQLKGVIVHFLLAANTIEQRLAYVLDKKLKISNEVLDGEAVEKEALLTELINSYTKTTYSLWKT